MTKHVITTCPRCNRQINLTTGQHQIDYGNPLHPARWGGLPMVCELCGKVAHNQTEAQGWQFYRTDHSLRFICPGCLPNPTASPTEQAAGYLAIMVDLLGTEGVKDAPACGNCLLGVQP